MTGPISRIPPSPGPGIVSIIVAVLAREMLQVRSQAHTALHQEHNHLYLDTTCTPWNFPMVLSIRTPTCSIVAVVSRTVVVSPICPRHQDDGVTPLVDTGQW